ncbi:gamma-glutamyl-gamma-aminobutyrate hydrolase family protein [Sphingomonas sp. HF-S3]|uniref:Gamma-glutamyl-gamma-aminobutyrate hydrolase family protein n=1 Tax=Sphingomonas rustica TaxID=3103142 RepID=A0ABV0B6L3_9SPHN
MTAPFFLPRPAHAAAGPRPPRKPVVGVLCCNEVHERPIQAVASRFIEPLSRVSGASVLLVPALADALDAVALADRLDGLLLTGSRSNVAAAHYGGAREACESALDHQRDTVALALAAHMIEAGRPVFGICRGLQELNVLFGGTLTAELPAGSHHLGERDGVPFEALFDHDHDVALVEGGLLHASIGSSDIRVNSVHHQGIDRLGSGLSTEAISPGDSLVEAFSARPCGAPVLAVQWHPEWNYAQRPEGRAFFGLVGDALRERADA